MPTADELGVIPGARTLYPAIAPDNATFGADPVVHLARAEARKRGRKCTPDCTASCRRCNGNTRGYVLRAVCPGGPGMTLEHAPADNRWRWWRRAKWCEPCQRYAEHLKDAGKQVGQL